MATNLYACVISKENYAVIWPYSVGTVWSVYAYRLLVLC